MLTFLNSNQYVIDIQPTAHSRINEVDFNQLTFGKIFTDHMFECDYENGVWTNPTIKPYGPLTIYPGTKVLHYGQAVFEGMKAFKDADGSIFLFRPEENFKRINQSSERLAIPHFPKDLFFEAIEKLLHLDQGWVHQGQGHAMYIRPFVFASETGVSAAAATTYKFMVIMSPVTAYYSEKLKVLIAEKYSRAADGGVGYAKAAGNYAAQFYPTNLARAKGFHQVIWTDAQNHEFLEEAGTMNVFFRIQDTLITAPTSDRILDGVTRKSIIDLARAQGIDVSIRKFSVTELIAAHQSGDVKEIFGSGTAATVSAISGFSYQENFYNIEDQDDSYAHLFKGLLQDIQYNRSDDEFGWRHQVL
jgi:branched-chain amino acid aminotransferase